MKCLVLTPNVSLRDTLDASAHTYCLTVLLESGGGGTVTPESRALYASTFAGQASRASVTGLRRRPAGAP